jgi:superfamily II DNA or RNA helicase
MSKSFSIRTYQQQAIDKILKVYKDNPTDQRAFLQLPTGCGKTWTAFQLALNHFKNKKKVRIVWTAHQTELVKQSYGDFFEFLGKKPSDSGKMSYTHDNVTMEFTTWQSLRNSKTKYDMLIIDECHFGGGITGATISDHKSFKSIMKLATTHLYISATPYNLDEVVFEGLLEDVVNRRTGKNEKCPKNDRVAVYDMDQAYTDGFLVNVQFNCIRSADTIKWAEVVNGDIEEVGEGDFEDFNKFGELIEKKEIDVKCDASKDALAKAALNSVLDVFFEKECVDGKIPPTMVFCRTSRLPALGLENVRRAILKKSREKCWNIKNIGKNFVDVISSEHDDVSGKIAKFKAGEINILCVVGMAREGFNYKELECALDFNYNDINRRLHIQKVGRMVRTNPGKAQARYYYPDTYENYIRFKGGKKELTPQAREEFKAMLAQSMGVSIESISDDMLDAKVAETSNRTISKAETSENDEVGVGSVEVVTPRNKKSPSFLSSGSYFINLANYKSDDKPRVRTNWLFDRLQTVTGTIDPTGCKEYIRKFYEINKRLPSTFDDIKLNRRMHSYVQEKSESYCKNFSQWARSVGYGEDTINKAKTDILNFYKKHKVFPKSSKHRDKNENRLAAYLSKFTNNNEYHDEEFFKKCKKFGFVRRIGKHTFESVQESSSKFKTSEDWKKGDNASLTAARLNGWFEEVTQHMNKRTKWTKTLALAEMKKYQKRGDFLKKSSSAAGYLVKHNIYEKYAKMYLDSPQIKWTKELALKEAKKFNNLQEFRENSSGCYCFSRVNNLLNTMFPGYKKTRAKFVFCLETKQIFNSALDACRKFGIKSSGNMSRAIKTGTPVEGFHFFHCDENGKPLKKGKK